MKQNLIIEVIKRNRKRFPPASVDLVSALLQEILRPSGDVNFGAAGAEEESDPAADALRGARDDANLAFQIWCHCCAKSSAMNGSRNCFGCFEVQACGRQLLLT